MGNFPLQQNKLWQNCPFSFWNIDSRKAGRGRGSKKEMGDPERERKAPRWWERDSNWQHPGTFLYPSDNDIAPCQTKSDSEKSEGGGLWRDGTKADDIQGEIEAEIAILLVIIFLQMMCVHVCACSGLSSPHCCECYRQCCVQCCRVTKLKYYFSWCDSCFQNRKK